MSPVLKLIDLKLLWPLADCCADDVPNHVVTQRNSDFGPNRIRSKSNRKSYESNQIPIMSREIES